MRLAAGGEGRGTGLDWVREGDGRQTGFAQRGEKLANLSSPPFEILDNFFFSFSSLLQICYRIELYR